MNWIDDVRWFLWDCWTWCKVRIWPDKRPSSVLIAEVKEKLSQMPAGKEIHEALRHLDAYETTKAQRGGNSEEK